MEKCLVVINRESGGFNKRTEARVRCALPNYGLKFIDIDSDYVSGISDGTYDAICVCGGDGTLNSVVNKIKNADTKLFYFPCGTLNERAKARRFPDGKLLVGCVGNDVFTYVYACGSFTPIGYTATSKTKRTFKTLAYLSRVFSEYRVHDIPARLTIDGRVFDGSYTLIMVIKSERCFGFPFNKLYSPDEKTAHLLLIRSRGKDNVTNRIKMFFPFFRTFFIGFRREIESQNLIFKRFSNLGLELAKEVDFCVDGEKRTSSGKLSFCVDEVKPRLTVLNLRKVYRS